MKTLRSLGILILVGISLLSFLSRACAGSATIAATISIRVLEKPKEGFVQSPDLQECLESQLQKNPGTMPEIKVEETAQNALSGEPGAVRYTICEKV